MKLTQKRRLKKKASHAPTWLHEMSIRTHGISKKPNHRYGKLGKASDVRIIIKDGKTVA